MSSANHERDSDWDPEEDADALNSDDEALPFSLSSSSSSTIFLLPSSTSVIQIFPPGHTFVENYVAVDTNPNINLVEQILLLESRKPNFDSWLNETLWSLFSVMAFDSLSSSQNTTSTWEANLLLVSSMDALIQNIDKMSYLQDNLICYLPSKNIPAHVLKFILQIRDSKLTSKFAKITMSTSEKKKKQEEIKISQFGARIWLRAQSVRSTIMNRINKLWIKANRVKSGSGNNSNSILVGIQRLTWPMECMDRAGNNASTYVSRLKAEQKKDKDVIVPTFEDAYQAAFRKVYPRENAHRWIPDYWISFLLIGMPAGDDGRTVLGAGL